MSNAGLRSANKAKKDEFYTQLSDIENELKHYRDYFRGKVVFCNADDPYESNFFKYFAMNFNFLGLKKLIATNYVRSPITYTELPLFQSLKEKKPYVATMSSLTDENGDGATDLEDVRLVLQKLEQEGRISVLHGDGDFRSDEAIECLKEADIVVTNPPFSLFREFVAQLEEYNKSFIILGNTNALTYKEIFALFKENRMRTGYTKFNTGMYFVVPDSYEKYHKIENGRKMVRVSTSCWYTNLDVRRHHEDLIMYKKYTPEEYPRYENYDAINVDKFSDIPMDYAGAMGVPITFLDKYNPQQFEIEALGIVGSCQFTKNRRMEILDKNGQSTGKYTMNAKGTLYKKYNPLLDKRPAFKDAETGELYASIYARVIIRNKRLQNL